MSPTSINGGIARPRVNYLRGADVPHGIFSAPLRPAGPESVERDIRAAPSPTSADVDCFFFLRNRVGSGTRLGGPAVIQTKRCLMGML
jgi:hypothetical protein